jgi:mono/diheme cytochrome c family protein
MHREAALIQVKAVPGRSASLETEGGRTAMRIRHWIAGFSMGLACASAPAAESGADLFLENCAACHGVYAEGDGPAISALAVPVPDLTTLASRHGGTYPAELVRAVVDGRSEQAAHGSRSMPIWGNEFWLEAGADDYANREVAARIQALVEYLESVQAAAR